MTNISEKGGMIKGPSHANGGVRFVVDGRIIEAEGGEPVLPGEALLDDRTYTFTGKNIDIINQINQRFGAKSIAEKTTNIEAGDIIICKVSAKDDTEYTYTGTLQQIISEINQSGGGKPVNESGATMENSHCECQNELAAGGSVPGATMNLNADSKVGPLVVRSWNDLPEAFRIVRKVNQVSYAINPYDKGLLKIMDPFVSDDELRPVMTGLNFNEHGVVATDAHKLLFIPAHTKYSGVYCTSSSCIKFKNTVWKVDVDSNAFKISGDVIENVTYPNYPKVFPDYNPFVYTVDLLKLKTYCEALIKAKLLNNVTNAFSAPIGKDNSGDDILIGINAKFLIEVCTSFLMLGHRSVYFGFSTVNRAIVLSPNQQAAERPAENVNKNYIMGLIMPIVMQDWSFRGQKLDNNFMGSSEWDYERHSRFYFDFTKNAIVNENGSIAEFDESLIKASERILSEDQVDLLKAVSNNGQIPIVDKNVKIENGVAMATSLQTSVIIKGANGGNGIYSILSGELLNDPTIDADDFPKAPDEREYKKIATISRSELLFHLEIAAKCIGNDELRPIYSGIFMTFRSGKIMIESTDAHVLYRNYITNGTILVEDNASILFPDAKIFVRGLKIADSETVDIYASGNNVAFEVGEIKIVTRQLEGRYPQVEAVVPNYFPNKMVIEVFKFKECVSALPKEAEKTGSLQFYKNNSDSMSVFYIKEKEGNRNEYEKREVCQISFEISEEKDFRNDRIGFFVMPAMGAPEESPIIGFTKVIINKIFANINDQKITLEYSTKNRIVRVSGEHPENYWSPENIGEIIQSQVKSAIRVPKKAPVTKNEKNLQREAFARSENDFLSTLAAGISKPAMVAKKGGVVLCPVGTEIQSLVFSKDNFDPAKARSWARRNNFRYQYVDEKANTLRIRQKPPTKMKNFKTITLTTGVNAVIGCPIKTKRRKYSR